MNPKREVFDLGNVLARVEEDIEGLPLVTLLSPATEFLPPQEIYVTSDGVEGLLKLAQFLRYWTAKPTLGVPDTSNHDAPLQSGP